MTITAAPPALATPVRVGIRPAHLTVQPFGVAPRLDNGRLAPVVTVCGLTITPTTSFAPTDWHRLSASPESACPTCKENYS